MIFRQALCLIFVIGSFAGYAQDDYGASTFLKSGTGSFYERSLGFSGPMVTGGGVAYKYRKKNGWGAMGAMFLANDFQTVGLVGMYTLGEGVNSSVYVFQGNGFINSGGDKLSIHSMGFGKSFFRRSHFGLDIMLGGGYWGGYIDEFWPVYEIGLFYKF